MKIKFMLIMVLAISLSAGCATIGNNRSADKNVRKYLADLNGSGINLLVETNDKTSSESRTLVTVKSNDKTGEVIDSFSLPGKIRNLDFAELNHDGQNWIVVCFDGKDNLSNLDIYQLKNNKLVKVFSAHSAYGIESTFEGLAKIKIGKSLQGNSSPNLVPLWDTWVWSGDKFILD